MPPTRPRRFCPSRWVDRDRAWRRSSTCQSMLPRGMTLRWTVAWDSLHNPVRPANLADRVSRDRGRPLAIPRVTTSRRLKAPTKWLTLLRTRGQPTTYRSDDDMIHSEVRPRDRELPGRGARRPLAQPPCLASPAGRTPRWPVDPQDGARRPRHPAPGAGRGGPRRAAR